MAGVGAVNGSSMTVPEARLQFRRCEMKSDNFDDYFAELQKLSNYCKFSDASKEERLVEQIIHGISDDTLRSKLVSEDEIPLTAVLKECRLFYSQHSKTNGSQAHADDKETELGSEIETDRDTLKQNCNGNSPLDNLSSVVNESIPSVNEVRKKSNGNTSRTTRLKAISTTSSESNTIKVIHTDTDKDEIVETHEPLTVLESSDVVCISSKTNSSKTAKGIKSMRPRLKRLDSEVLEKFQTVEPKKETLRKTSKSEPDTENTTSEVSKNTVSLNDSLVGTTSDDEVHMNLLQVKKKHQKGESKDSKLVKTVSLDSDESMQEDTNSKPESKDQSEEENEGESEDNSSESTDEEVEEIMSPESDSDSDFDLKSEPNVRRSRRIKEDKKAKEKKKNKKNKKGSKSKERKSKRKRVVDNLNVSDEISDEDDNNDDDSVNPAKQKASKKKKRRVVFDDDESNTEETTVELSSTTNTETAKEDVKDSKQVEKNKKKGEDDEDDEDGSPGKSKRKNIRQILSTKDLEKDTRKANLEERERRKRIGEKSKDGMTDFYTREKDGRVVYTRICFEKKGEDDLVCMHEDLANNLKPHQVEGVQFLWDCTVESSSRAKETKGSGAILAHCMGLGKTLQVISFIHTMLTNEVLPFTTALIIVPANTILNWVNEFEIWTPDEEELDVYEISQHKDDKTRASVLKNWHDKGGIMIIGYNMFRIFVNPTRKKAKRFLPKVKEALLDPGPDFVVCDEGHLLKNDQTALSKAVSQISTRRRIVLTGTPLQNNLVEYHCMVNFVKENLLGTKNEFRNRFINPISNGQQKDASNLDVKVMKRRSHVLHELLAGAVQRRDYCYITKYLPPKYEYVLSVRLSERQIRLYNKYLKLFCFEHFDSSEDGSSTVDSLVIPTEHQVVRRDGSRSLFKDFQNLARIWTHPYCLKLVPPKDTPDNSEEEEDFVCEDSEEDDKKPSRKGDKSTADEMKPSTSRGKTRGKRSDSEEECSEKGDNDDEDDDDEDENDKESKEVIKKYKTQTGRGSGKRVRELSPPPEDNFWFSDILKEEDQFNVALSGKLVLLCEILKRASEVSDKVLLFSQSLMSLTLIEDTLAMITEAKKNNWQIGETDSEGFMRTVDGTEAGEGVWVPNKDYLRLDGGSSVPLRKKMCDQFNAKSNKRCRLFLISTKAGSLGINLFSANRCIIFDASWNPSHDIQSMFRCYRFGQLKPVYVYRFIAQGTMEEKIYNRQVTKESLSMRVVDESQIDRHFSKDELEDLYQFEPNLYKESDTSVPSCAVPKDDLLADLLLKRKDLLYKYHIHDSLLEHQADQNLSEEDKKAAWEEYEKERAGGPNPAQVRQQQMREQMMTANMQALQQQYARQQHHSLQVQQQAQDGRYLEKACQDMIIWGSSIGLERATRDFAARSIQSFINAIRGLTPTISFKALGDKVYDLFPNYYLGLLGIRNPKFASNEELQQPVGASATSNHVNQGFGVNDVQMNPVSNDQTKKPETVTLSTSNDLTSEGQTGSGTVTTPRTTEDTETTASFSASS